MESAQFQEASPVFAIFEAISAIPRGSGNEAAIAAWLLDFAHAKGWQGQRDAAGNVLLLVAGSAGRETHKPLVVQAHMDMVCEKLPGSAHDFERDPLRIGIDGDWLRAEGTTLGADDGIGMALALALAEDDTLVHPPLELLFTVQEETNLVGAQKLDASLIRGRRLLNIDSETEGIFTIGCAGGRTSHLELPLIREATPLEGHTTVHLSLGGLQGGHSGMDIGKRRGNANKILARALALLAEQTDLRLLTFNGGSRSNVIPDRAEAVVAVADPQRAEECVARFAQEITSEFGGEDTTPHLTFEECVCDTPPLVESCNAAVLRLLEEMPDGVHQYEENGLIRTSNNCAIVSCKDDTLWIESLQRSSQTAELDALTGRIAALAESIGARIESNEGYPAWEPHFDSSLLAACQASYRALYGKEAQVEVTHAGLECGALSAHFPDMEMISLGPDIENPHSPWERLRISSVVKVWRLLRHVVEHLEG